MNYIESSANKNIEKLWIIISILSLALGGLYSIFIVLLRTPFVSEFFLNKSIFKTSLIIHVDLTVLFWLTSFMMMIMSSNFVGFFARTTQNLQYIIIFSILLISASPAVSSSTPFLNNYVPVLHNFLFIVGLGLFFSCFVVIAIFAIISGSHISIPLGILSLMICISFGDSAYKLGYASDILDQSHYYELLFWGCGHLLQFLYISGLIIIWYSPQISEASKNTHSSIRVEYLIYLNCMIVIFPLLIQLSMDIENSYYIYLFTEHMKIFGAVSFLICLIDAAVYQFFAKQAYQATNLIKVDEDTHTKKITATSLFLSLILFSCGGVIAIFISGANAVIPAHYHGSIVGITIGFMGYIYNKTNQIFSQINFKNALRQLYIYSFGQLIHILGLSASGGYGALRKTPGADLPLSAKISLSFMGIGGLLAIVGGLIFVYICTMSIIRSKTS